MKPRFLLAWLLYWSFTCGAADLGKARAWVDEGRYAEALAEFQALLEANPTNTDLLIEVARVNAWADRHSQAATLYGRALEVSPERRHDILLPLAWQLAWGNRHDAAIPLFMEASQRAGPQQSEALHGLAESLRATNQPLQALGIYQQLAADTSDLKAQKAVASMLSELEKHEQAASRYRAILQTQPQDQEARIGLARALNHGGRHFAAVSAYQAAINDTPVLAHDTRAERALALRRAGLEDQAMLTLGDATGNAVLRSRLKQETASHLRSEFEFAQDSDKLNVHALMLGWQQRFAGLNDIDTSLRAARIEQHHDLISGRQFLIRAGTRLGDVHHGLFWPALTLGVRDYEGWQTAAWKLQGKWAPADLWRVDLEAGNDVIENVTALNNKVTLAFIAAGADWRFAPRWSATLGGALLRFDDGNRRARLLARTEYVWLNRQPRVKLGLESMGFNDSNPALARGYYNPESYREVKIFAQAEHEVAGWQLAGKLALGRLVETPGGSSGLYVWELSASRDLDAQLRLRLTAGGSDSSAFLRTSSGYNRNYVGISLVWFH